MTTARAGVSDPLKTLQDRFGAQLNEALLEALQGDRATEHLFGMMRYQFGYVDDNLELVASPGGKRFRPLLCLFACDAANGDWQAALNTAVAIELLHNFSLVHDDIEDHDPERRHRATVWRVWGEPHAINVGDALFALSSRMLLRSDLQTDVLLQLVGQLEQVALTLTEGQYLDMSFEGRSVVTPGEYMDMIARKSAALISFSLWAGGRIAGSDQSTLHGLRRFGEEMGKAFQIHDDIMGVWGDPDVTGKQPAKDVENRKKTWPVLEAWRLSREQQRQQLSSFYAGQTNDMSAVLSILKETGARDHAEHEIRSRLEAAARELREVSLNEDSKKELEGIAAQLAGQWYASKRGTVAKE